MMFLSSRHLGLEPRVRSALGEMLRLMETGKFVQVRKADINKTLATPLRRGQRLFNMNYAMAEERPCGTVACMLGWIDRLRPAAGELDCYFEATLAQIQAFEALVMPRNWNEYTDRYTVPICAAALRSYLETGKPVWPKARRATQRERGTEW